MSSDKTMTTVGSECPDERSDVRSACFSRNSRRLAVGCDDGSIRIWQARGLKLQLVFAAHSGPVKGLAFSPDGKVLYSAGDCSIRYWDAATGRQLSHLGANSQGISGLALSRDGKLLASCGGDQLVRLWDAATGRCRHSLAGHRGCVNSVALSPDGKLASSGGADGSVRVWDVRTGRELHCLTGHDGSVTQVAFSPDGKTIGSCSMDRTVRLWTTATGDLIRSINAHAEFVRALAFSPDGNSVVSGGAEHCHSYDPAEYETDEPEPGCAENTQHDAEDEAEDENEDEDEYADEEYDSEEDSGRFWDYNDWRNSHTVEWWSLKTGKNTDTIYDSQGFISCLCFSPNGKLLLRAGEGQVFTLHSLPGRGAEYGFFPRLKTRLPLPKRPAACLPVLPQSQPATPSSREGLRQLAGAAKSQADFAEISSRLIGLLDEIEQLEARLRSEELKNSAGFIASNGLRAILTHYELLEATLAEAGEWIRQNPKHFLGHRGVPGYQMRPVCLVCDRSWKDGKIQHSPDCLYGRILGKLSAADTGEPS